LKSIKNKQSALEASPGGLLVFEFCVSPIANRNFLAVFSLPEGGAKKKLPKRNADRGVSRVATRDQRPTR